MRTKHKIRKKSWFHWGPNLKPIIIKALNKHKNQGISIGKDNSIGTLSMKEEQKKEVSSQSIEATKSSETHMKSDMFKTWPQDPAALLKGK